MTLYNDVIEKHPNRFVARNNRGFLKLENSDFNGAIQDFKVSIENKANYTEPLFGIAIAYQETGDIEKSFHFYNKYLKLSKKFYSNNSQVSIAYNNRGTLYVELRNYKSAYNDFNQAIQFNSTNVDAYINLCLVHLVTKNYNQAIRVSRIMEKTFKDNPKVIEVVDLVNKEVGEK